MKWVLIVILISVVMLIAHAVSEQYRDKFDFYYNLKLFLNQFKINISFKQAKVNEFINSIKPRKQFKAFINSYQSYLSGKELDFSEIKVLENQEKEELKDLINRIGKNDAKSELAQTEQFLLSVEEHLKKAEEDKNKLCPMILKLSLLFAIGVAILLI